MTRATGAMPPTVPASFANMHPSKCRPRLVSCYRCEDDTRLCAGTPWLAATKLVSFVQRGHYLLVQTVPWTVLACLCSFAELLVT